MARSESEYPRSHKSVSYGEPRKAQEHISGEGKSSYIRGGPEAKIRIVRIYHADIFGSGDIDDCPFFFFITTLVSLFSPSFSKDGLTDGVTIQGRTDNGWMKGATRDGRSDDGRRERRWTDGLTIGGRTDN